MLELHPELLDKLLRDPVMSAYAIAGVELDWFQNIRLRYNWFVPHKVDSSGWGTGKSIGEWVYAILRAVLIPGNQVGVYYPIFQTGKTAWWMPNFNNIRHPVLEAQYKSGKNEYRDQGCWRKCFKNGSEIFLPAPGFSTDAKSQVSQTFQTMIVGEYTQAALRGEGVDELIGRLRGECFNKNHPLWGHHSLLSAHAEDPMHPSHRYYTAARDAARGQFTQEEQHKNVCYTFCYLDWSDKPYKSSTFKKKFREESMIVRSKRNLMPDDFRRRMLGLWSANGKGWYPETVIGAVLRSECLPMTERPPGTAMMDLFVLGQDTAPGQSAKADECAFTVWRIREVALGEEFTEEAGGRFFHIAPVFCHVFKNVDAGQISGFIHALHLAFGLSLIVLDPGGGGAWVYKELIKPRQLIHNAMRDVVPLCTRDEPNQADKQAIVVFFKRGSELDALWQRQFLQSDEGIIEAAHRELRKGFETRAFHWPQRRENRPRVEFTSMPEASRWAQIYLDLAWKQATTIRVKTTGDGKPMLTARGFMKFEQQGTKKKDAIYSVLYGYCAVRLILLRITQGTSGWEDDVVAG
jgi:hypothetical protein